MAKITVQAISRKAKTIRKKGEPWISAIKRASKMLKGKGGTVGATRKKAARRKPAKSVPKKKAYKPRKPIHQTGKTSRKIDKRIKAKAPGKRKSSSGATYYEYRRNRSDMPGQMTGTKKIDGSAYREMIMGRMQSADRLRTTAEHQIKDLQEKKKRTPAKEKLHRKMIDVRIKELRKLVAVQKKEISMLKALYK
jgi:hypothetical protein